MRQILIIALLIVCSVNMVSAGSVTFTDPLDSYVYTVYITEGNTTQYLGDFTVNETLILSSSEDYQVFVKPNSVSLVSDPIQGAYWFMAYVPFIFSVSMVGLLVVGLFIIYKKGVRIS